MAKYEYHELWDYQFETLVVACCQKILGIGVHGFAPGPDGGKDALFNGTANLHPSERAPWQGQTVIQAKHTAEINASFSDVRFYSPTSASCIIEEELERIKTLRQFQQLDHYMLFSNRKLTAGTQTRISRRISEEANIPLSSVSLFGIEAIEMLLHTFPDIATTTRINPLERPLAFTSDEIAEIIEAFADSNHARLLADPPEIQRVTIEEKNRINMVNAAYYANAQNRYLPFSQQIQRFLADPQNIRLKARYQDAVDDIQAKLLALGDESTPFSQTMEYITDHYIRMEAPLASHKALVRAIVFHMYWFCDIGKATEVEIDADEARSSGSDHSIRLRTPSETPS